MGSISTDRMIGRNIKREINKPKNISLNDMKCEENNRPFDNWTNGISYGLSYESPHDLFLDSIRDIMIQTWNRNMVDPWGSLNGCIIELIHDSLNETVNDSIKDSIKDLMNDSMHNLMNTLLKDSINDSMRYSLEDSINNSMDNWIIRWTIWSMY